jgi:hypothetical protein
VAVLRGLRPPPRLQSLRGMYLALRRRRTTFLAQSVIGPYKTKPISGALWRACYVELATLGYLDRA